MKYFYDIPSLPRVVREVAHLERLLDRLEEPSSPESQGIASDLPVVAHWFEPPRGAARIFRHAAARDDPAGTVEAIDIGRRWMHDGERFWRLGPPSPTNDNVG